MAMKIRRNIIPEDTNFDENKKKYELEIKKIELEQKKLDLEMKKLENGIMLQKDNNECVKTLIQQ